MIFGVTRWNNSVHIAGGVRVGIVESRGDQDVFLPITAFVFFLKGAQAHRRRRDEQRTHQAQQNRHQKRMLYRVTRHCGPTFA